MVLVEPGNLRQVVLSDGLLHHQRASQNDVNAVVLHSLSNQDLVFVEGSFFGENQLTHDLLVFEHLFAAVEGLVIELHQALLQFLQGVEQDLDVFFVFYEQQANRTKGHRSE